MEEKNEQKQRVHVDKGQEVLGMKQKKEREQAQGPSGKDVKRDSGVDGSTVGEEKRSSWLSSQRSRGEMNQ